MCFRLRCCSEIAFLLEVLLKIAFSHQVLLKNYVFGQRFCSTIAVSLEASILKVEGPAAEALAIKSAAPPLGVAGRAERFGREIG